jgi:hypothetical protein
MGVLQRQDKVALIKASLMVTLTALMLSISGSTDAIEGRLAIIVSGMSVSGPSVSGQDSNQSVSSDLDAPSDDRYLQIIKANANTGGSSALLTAMRQVGNDESVKQQLRADLESCFQQLPEDYRQLHTARFMTAFPAVGDDDCQAKLQLLMNWQKLNTQVC